MLTHEHDVLRALGITTAQSLRTAHHPIEGLEGDPRTADELAATWKCSVGDALARLFDLELEGRIEQLPGRRFAAR